MQIWIALFLRNKVLNIRSLFRILFLSWKTDKTNTFFEISFSLRTHSILKQTFFYICRPFHISLQIFCDEIPHEFSWFRRVIARIRWYFGLLFASWYQLFIHNYVINDNFWFTLRTGGLWLYLALLLSNILDQLCKYVSKVFVIKLRLDFRFSFVNWLFIYLIELPLVLCLGIEVYVLTFKRSGLLRFRQNDTSRPSYISYCFMDIVFLSCWSIGRNRGYWWGKFWKMRSPWLSFAHFNLKIRYVWMRGEFNFEIRIFSGIDKLFRSRGSVT